MPLNIVVIYGSVRSERQGIKAARFIVKMLESRGHTVTLIDPLEFQLPFLDKMYKEYGEGEAPETMQKLSTLYKAADAFVVVSAEYNHSLPAALKNLLDHFMEEYFWRPAGIVTYSSGSFAGVRVGDHLRVVLGEIGMVTLPSTFPISKVQSSFDEEGNALDEAYERRSKKFLDELEWYAKALQNARKEGVPY